MNSGKRHLLQDGIIILLSIAFAVALARSDILDRILRATQDIYFLESFVAGIFFTSVFTTAIATVVLGKLTLALPLWEVILFGGLGALAGDFIIFGFMRRRLSADTEYLLGQMGIKRLFFVFHLRFFRLFVPFLGALIIASPLPDELGLALLGVSGIRPLYFVFISLFMNMLGILAIGLIARAIL